MKHTSTHKTKAAVFGPLGYCMYGREHSAPLTKEHVVPRALGGGVIIQRSSCETCAAITCKIENNALGKALKMFRFMNDLEVSDAKKRPITHAKVYVRDGAKLIPKVVPIGERPSVLTLPVIEALPAIVTQANEAPKMFIKHYYRSSDEAMKIALEKGYVAVEEKYDANAFFRMLAKIAHGFMYVHFKPDNIRPFLLDYILKDGPHEYWRHIGTNDRQLEVSANAPYYGVHRIECRKAKHRATMRWFVIVNIRLFAKIGDAEFPVPTYNVIVGDCEAMPQLNDWKSR